MGSREWLGLRDGGGFLGCLQGPPELRRRVDPGLGIAQCQHGGLQLGRRERVRDAHEVFESPADAEARSRRQPQAEVRGDDGERCTRWRGQPAPRRSVRRVDVPRANRAGARQASPSSASRFRRSSTSRASSGSAKARSNRAAANCSTTGPPRSIVVRDCTNRLIKSSSARIHPVRSPAQCDLLSEPMVTTRRTERPRAVRC